MIAGRAEEPEGQEILQANFSLQYIIGNTTILQSDSESMGHISMEELFHSQMVRNLTSNNLQCAKYITSLQKVIGNGHP